MTNHNHQHHHSHAHGHVHTDNKKVLMFSFIIISLFMLVEIIGGFLANSLALLSDGFHMLSDAISLGVTLFIISIIIIIEAIRRFLEPPEVQSKEMFIISVIGLMVNIIVAILMFKGGDTSHNLNMRGAFLHVLGDLFGSVGPIVASLLIWGFNFTIADPIASILVSLIILKSAYGISKSSLNILMEGTPNDIDLNAVIKAISKDERIQNVHDCHVWTISNDMNALSCHAVVPEYLSVQTCETMLKSIESDLLQLNIQHMTIQLETPEHKHDESTLCSGIHEHSH